MARPRSNVRTVHWWDPARVRRIVTFVLLLGVVLGVLGNEVTLRTDAGLELRARWLQRSGRVARAERIYWDLLQKGPVTVPRLVAFLDVHRSAAPALDPRRVAGVGLPAPKQDRKGGVTDEEVARFLARRDLPREVALLGRWAWHAEDGDEIAYRAQVEEAADASPPMPWANHLLARAALVEGRPRVAVQRYLREGLAFPERRDDVEHAMRLLVSLEDWSTLARALADPTLGPHAGAWAHFELAMHEGDARGLLRWAVPYTFHFPGWAALALCTVPALAWLAFLLRLGLLRESPRLRAPMVLAAFALGVFSVVPTLLVAGLEERRMHFVETGIVVKDALFFVLGVGLREEACKLLAFLPLLPILLKRGNRLDVLVCGAMVGLGFAAEENLGYIAHGDLTTAMARFLTANFFHMALTALAADALYEFLRSKEDRSFDFTKTFLILCTIHGAYDFFLTAHVVENLSYFAMAVFVVLTRNFLVAVDHARVRAGRGLPLLPVFAVGMAAVMAASFAYAVAMVGYWLALMSMFEGILGVGILVYVFFHELDRT